MRVYDSKKIQVTMSDEEVELIRKKSEEAELSMSKYLRELGLNGSIQKHDYSTLIEMNTLLSSLDQSLKHLVYKDYPNKELVRKEIRELTESHNKVILEVRKLLKIIKKG